MALEKRPLVDVKVPIGDADGEVAERVGCDVDAAGNKTVALHRREGSIVPDDLGDRIRRRHAASSSAIVGHARPDTQCRVGLTQGSQLPGATLLRKPSASASERSHSSSSRDIPAHSGTLRCSAPAAALLPMLLPMLDSSLRASLVSRFTDAVMEGAALPAARRRDVEEAPTFSAAAGEIVCMCSITGSTYAEPWGWEQRFRRSVC